MRPFHTRQDVKVIFFNDFSKKNRVRYRTGVFGELRAAHHTYIGD